ncbi:MAG: histidine phosphatase family protein [Candidatus Staskawiczbacteria bacterium]|nr:histidine phosphatase family protein [Candidatus Staskawiczbacteria bacterium]
MISKLFIIRHPETINNRDKIIQDPLKGELSEFGRSQIPFAVKQLMSLGITKVYSSDSLRCIELAKAFSKISGLKINYDPIFREVNSGEWIGMKKDDVKKLISQHKRPKNGEDLDQLMERAKNILNNLIKEEGNILLIIHGCIGKMLIGATKDMDPYESDEKFSLKNCQIIELDLKNLASIPLIRNRKK